VAALFLDPDTDPATCIEVLQIDLARSAPLAPCIVINPDRLQADAEVALLVEGVTGLIRRRRQRRYAERIEAGWRGPRLVAGGDSWFQFPLTRDIVHQLEPDHAIHCLSGAVDPLHNLLGQQRLCDAVVEHRPDAILLSVGGGALMDPVRLTAFVKPHAAGLPADAYPTAYLDQFLALELMPRISALLQALRRAAPRTPVLLHSYAPAIPRNFIWLGHPLRSRGIDDNPLQRRIMAAIIDRFHAALQALTRRPVHANVHLVDCRDAIGPHWFDELHPNNLGFERAAQRFRAAIAALS
jgi:lysophospholipase L1-like esterase